MTLRTNRSPRSCSAYFCRGSSLRASHRYFSKFPPDQLAGFCIEFIITFHNTRKTCWIMRSLFYELKVQDSQMKRKLWIAWPFLLSLKIFTVCISLFKQPDLQLVLPGQQRSAGFLQKKFRIILYCVKLPSTDFNLVLKYAFFHVFFIYRILMPLSLNVKYISNYFIICININLYLNHLQNINLHWFSGSDLQGNFIFLIFFFF